MSEEPNYKIGDRIILKQKQKVLLGTIRYIGEVTYFNKRYLIAT